MKYLKWCVVSTISLAVFSPISHAGFFDRLADRVERSVENAVSGRVANKAADQAGEATDAVINPEPSQPESAAQTEVESSRTQIENSAGESNGGSSTPVPTSSSPSSSAAMPGLGGLSSMLEAMQQEAKHDKQYPFEFSIDSEITDQDQTSRLTQFFAVDSLGVDTGEGEFMVLDMRNEAMLMINNKERQYTAMSTAFMKQMASMGTAMARAQEDTVTKVDRMEKTGRTKEILGYSTEEWVFESDGDRGEIWITSALDFNFVEFNRNLLKMFDNGGGQLRMDFSNLQGQLPQGFPLETYSYENGKLQTTMKAVRVERSPAPIDLSGYQVRSMMGN